MKKSLKIVLIISLVINFVLIIGGGYEAYHKGLIFKKQITQYPINYYIQKSGYDSLKINTGEIEFLGDSLTDYGQWSEYFNNSRIINRGIVGDDTERLLSRVNEAGTPSKLFVMAGINDLVEGKSVNGTVSSYGKLIAAISKKAPNTKIYIESTLPINPNKYRKNYPSYKSVKSNDIQTLNNKLKGIAKKYNAIFVDLYPLFTVNGSMNPNYTVDGVHLTGSGYKVWMNAIKKYVQ